MTDEWDVDRLDLPAYLDRVGQRAGDPTAETLARLHRSPIEWFLQERGADGWGSVYGMTTEPQHAVDVEVANHFTSTHPSSPFVGRIVVVREDEDSRTRLVGRTLATVGADGVEARREVDDAELPVVLRERFGIVLDPEDLAAVLAAPGRQERS